MGKIIFDGNGIIKLDGKPVRHYNYNDNEEIVIEFTPFAQKGVNMIPYAVKVKIEDNTVSLDTDLVTVIDWGANNYELRFKQYSVDTYVPPQALAQAVVYEETNDETVFTVYKDNKCRIVIESNNLFYTHTLKGIIENPHIKINDADDRIVCAVTGKCGKNYYLLIILVKEKCEILFEQIANKVTFNKNNIQITKALHDMQGRMINYTMTYDGSKYVQTSKSIEYSYNHEYKNKLVPYALLEAIMAKDTNEASKYLCEELEAENLFEFFGNIVEIDEPKFTSYNKENIISVINKENNQYKATDFQFIIESDKIIDIIEQDISIV